MGKRTGPWDRFVSPFFFIPPVAFIVDVLTCVFSVRRVIVFMFGRSEDSFHFPVCVSLLHFCFCSGGGGGGGGGVLCSLVALIAACLHALSLCLLTLVSNMLEPL